MANEDLRQHMREIPSFRPPFDYGVVPSTFPVMRDFLVNQTNRAEHSQLIIEGPPVYLWPDRRSPSQDWSSPQFQSGWIFTDYFVNTTSSLTNQWMLLDEIHNTPYGFDPKNNLGILNQFTSQIKNLPFDLPTLRQSDQVFLEGDFLRKVGSDSCSKLDAAFQLTKIDTYTYDSLQPLLVLVHPEEFVSQQKSMLTELLGQMKNNYNFSSMTKDDRRKFIEQTFFHVWTDGNGELSGITKPQWSERAGKFVFAQVL